MPPLLFDLPRPSSCRRCFNEATDVVRGKSVLCGPFGPTEIGFTALAEAAFKSNSGMVQALLGAGAGPDAVSKTSDVAAAKLLLDKGAKPNVKEAQVGPQSAVSGGGL